MTEEASPNPSPMARLTNWRSPKARYLLISLLTLVLDQWSKWLVELHIDRHDSFEVIPGLLNFTLVRNTGVAFGLFAAHDDFSRTLVLTLLGIGALLFVAYYYFLIPREERLLLIALALVIGGAIGNLLDRIMNGGVTDFIDFYYGTYHWHTFNIADSAITVGIALMILGSFKPQEETEDTPSVPESVP